MWTKEAQFAENKRFLRMDRGRGGEKERKQEHFRILPMPRYLDPASCFTLLVLRFIGKKFHILLRYSMVALYLNLRIFQLLVTLLCVFSCSTPTAKLNQSWCRS